MVNINFKNNYKIIHVTNEIGKYMFGGIGSYMNELYHNRASNIGFVHLYNERDVKDIYLEKYPGREDILSLPFEEAERLQEINCEIVVVHFYGLAFAMSEEFINNKKIVYVIHLVPYSEPYILEDPFAGDMGIQTNFEYLCEIADKLICVSEAEKVRLLHIYDRYIEKTAVIYNGITRKDNKLQEIRKIRKRFGYIGRFDYRKGILECIKEIRHLDVELYIASDKDDPIYFNTIKEYIEAAGIKEKVIFLGWCEGKRRDKFFETLDALIIPSLYEPFGYVVVEGVNEGVPIITSIRGGIQEIVGDYKYNYDPYDEGALAEKIQLFMSDTEEEIKEQQSYLQERIEYFTAEKMNQNYNDMFQEL